MQQNLKRSTLALTVATMLLLHADVRAQELGWSGAVEGSGTLLFGSTSQRLLAGLAQLGRADSTIDVSASARFGYTESVTDAGKRDVTGRSAFASLAVDLQPFMRYSPFWFGTAESSLQQRIESRFGTGLGAKATLHRNGSDEISVSLALLAERTRSLETQSQLEAATSSRVRWSLRPRLRRQFSPVLGLSHVTFYQPIVDRPQRFTLSSTTTLSAQLATALAVTITLQDAYDSEARRRGARSNNDGQLLFGVRARF